MFTCIDDLSCVDLSELIDASVDEGYGMVKRLRDEYASGVNRFDREGESLYGYYDGTLLAIGGVNVESSKEIENAGRVRRVYVHPSIRGEGVGRQLIGQIMDGAKGYFTFLTCNTVGARGFYEHIGFKKVNMDGITHVYRIVQP